MIGRFACPPCASFFIVEQWLWQKNKVVTLNVSSNKNHRGDHVIHRKLKQPKDPVNIFHSLFKIIETKNV
jgi:hypothetical protein